MDVNNCDLSCRSIKFCGDGNSTKYEMKSLSVEISRHLRASLTEYGTKLLCIIADNWLQIKLVLLFCTSTVLWTANQMMLSGM